MWRFHRALPITNVADAISMGEGGTPIVRSARLGAALGIPDLYFKVEGANPTGSYKDRIAAVGLSCMRQLGVSGWAATSSGNAGAALAAYGARAGMTGKLFVLEHASRAKLMQILAYGPRVFAVRGLGSDPHVEKKTFDYVRSLCARENLALQITAFAFNPIGMEGAKTIAFELVEQLRRPPDVVYVPTGGGGLLTAIWKGFREMNLHPRIVCAQAEGCDPITQAWRENRALRPIPSCNSRISGIQLTAPPDGDLALMAIRASQGWATSVADSDIYAAQRTLARQEGLFVEPAAAATLAALWRDLRDGRLSSSDLVVCVLTGVGFKDAVAAQAMGEEVTIELVSVDVLT